MKQGKRPTRRQKAVLIAAGLDPHNWLVTKNIGDVLHLTQRKTGQEQVLSAGRLQGNREWNEMPVLRP